MTDSRIAVLSPLEPTGFLLVCFEKAWNFSCGASRFNAMFQIECFVNAMFQIECFD